MLLFGAALVVAGIKSESPVVTGMGIVIAVIGLLLFAYRQIKHREDASDAGFAAATVNLKAPASLVAVGLGALLVLIGTGSLTVGDPDIEFADREPIGTLRPPTVSVDVPEPEPEPDLDPDPVPPTSPATSSTTGPEPTAPPLPDPPDELPNTGIEADLLAAWAMVLVTGGRALTRMAPPVRVPPMA